MTHHIPDGYQLIPIAPYAAQIVPTRYPPPTSQPSPPEKPKPPLVFLLVIGGIIWLLITGNENQSSRQTRSDLERQNAQLTQENLYLRNQVDQLQHQLMGVYSAQ